MGKAAKAKEFQFLQPMISPNDAARQNRQVRSLAMKRVRKERKWTSRSNKHVQKVTLSGTKEVIEASGAIPENGVLPIFDEGILWPGLELGLVDPFWSIAIIPSPRMATLLHHYITVMSPPTGRNSRSRSEWFQSSQSNAAFLGTLLCISAMHRYAKGVGSYLNVLEQAATVVEAVNDNLANPLLAASPENMVAVAYLYFICVSPLEPPKGSPFEAWDVEQQPIIHLRGLRRMLDLAGGIASFTQYRLVYTCLLWFETIQAARRFYHFPHACLGNCNGYGCYGECAYSLKLLNLQAPIEITGAIAELQMLSVDIETWSQGANVVIDGMDLLQQSCHIMLRLLRSNSNVNDGTRGTKSEEAFLVGCLLFAAILTDTLNFNNQMIHNSRHYAHAFESEPLYGMARILQKKLIEARGECKLGDEPQLWLMVLGAIVTKGCPEEIWFRQQIEILLDSGGWWSSADDMVRVLHQTVWLASELDGHASELWDSVKAGRVRRIIHSYRPR